MAGALYLFFGVMSPLIGIMMFKLQPELVDTEGVLVKAALDYLPPVLTAIFIAALSSALMSTSDSSLLAGASVVVENLYPVLGKQLSDKQKVVQVRVWVVIIGIAAVIIALSAATIYELGVMAWSLLLVGLFAPFALGMYWNKANQIGGVSAYLGGFLAWAIGIYIAFNLGMGGDSTAVVCSGGDLSLLAADEIVWNCAFWDAVYIASFPAFLVSMALMVLVSLATQKMDAPKPITDIDGKPFDTNPFHNLGTLPLRDALRKMRPEEYDDQAAEASAD